MFTHNILAILALTMSVSAVPTNTRTNSPPQYAGSVPSQSCALPAGGALPVSGSLPVPIPTQIYSPQNGALPVSAPWSVSVPRPSPTGGTLPIGGVLPPGGTLPIGGSLPIGGVLPSPAPYPLSSPSSSSSSSGGDGSGNQNVGNGGQNAGNSGHNSGSVAGDFTVEQAVATCGNAQLNCCNKTVKKGDTTNSGLLGSVFGSGDIGIQCSPLNIAVLGIQVPINKACDAKAACCQGDTTQNGLINIGCVALASIL